MLGLQHPAGEAEALRNCPEASQRYKHGMAPGKNKRNWSLLYNVLNTEVVLVSQ